MTKDIPLSLQVFHSRNEFEAERLNRTEQIRLKDLHDVLKREEKLYVKNYALIKQRFNSKFKTRLDPYSIPQSLNTSRPTSVSSRISVFSAPGKLQTNRASSVDSSIASKMCSSFGEISTMNRFQRFQRKFSLASFTENGLLSKRGSKMSEDIKRAREILFKQNKSSIEFPKINESNVKLQSSAFQNRGINQESLLVNGYSESAAKELVIKNDGNFNQNIQFSDIPGRGEQKDVVQGSSGSKNGNDKNKSQRKILNFGAIVEESPQSSAVHDSHRDRVYFTNASNSSSANLSPSQINAKKKVTIRSVSHGTESDIYEANGENEGTNRNAIGEWRSILSKSNKDIDPLQQTINDFLAAQKDFNRIFPKRFDGVAKTSDLQNELASIGKEKREKESRDRKKKNEMVLEVLEKLGIEDEHIMCHYKDKQ